MSTLTNDTVPISITQIFEKVRGPCMAVLYSADIYMSCTLGFLYELTRFETLDEAPDQAMSTLGQKSRVD